MLLLRSLVWSLGWLPRSVEFHEQAILELERQVSEVDCLVNHVKNLEQLLRSSHVGWHSDDEPLFGERGEAKLIVSVSFGTRALFLWRGKSCPNNDGHSCWLGHGDILVMDGQCQDEVRHCTDPGSDQERIHITFRWVKQLLPPVPFLGQEWYAVCQRVRGVFLFLERR